MFRSTLKYVIPCSEVLFVWTACEPSQFCPLEKAPRRVEECGYCILTIFNNSQVMWNFLGVPEQVVCLNFGHLHCLVSKENKKVRTFFFKIKKQNSEEHNISFSQHHQYIKVQFTLFHCVFHFFFVFVFFLIKVGRFYLWVDKGQRTANYFLQDHKISNTHYTSISY
jgi:hypothetical protein